MLHVEQQHAGGIGVVAGMDAGQLVVDIIFRQHDFFDFCKVLRLVFAHPEELWGSETGEGNIRRQCREAFPTDFFIKIVHLLCRSAVIPENRRADHIALCIQGDEAVHLAAHADSGNLRRIKAAQQLRHTGRDGIPPVRRVLL